MNRLFVLYTHLDCVASSCSDVGVQSTLLFPGLACPSQSQHQGLVAARCAVFVLHCRYDPQTDLVRRPRPRMPGQMAELRAQLGDRELLAGGCGVGCSFGGGVLLED